MYNLKNVKTPRIQPATLIKVTLLHGRFSRFLNCTNDIKLRKALHLEKCYETD